MSRLRPPVGPEDHVAGDVNAKVTLVEYGDYECPYCGRAHRVVQEALRLAGLDVRFVFRHFPLAEMHPYALGAAEAAEAAGAQGQFWVMHDLLLEHQSALAPEDLLGYALAAGLDGPRSTQDLASHAHLSRVQADFGSGVRSGVNGTPTFFLQGERLDAGWDLDTLVTALREASRESAKPHRRAG
jgi:protein-disulfide isomerase